MDKHDINGARVVVNYLCSTGLRWHRNARKTNPWLGTFGAIGSTFSIHSHEGVVEKCFLTNDDTDEVISGSIENPHILLEPPQKNRNIVCLLGSRWRLTHDSSELSLYLHMFGQSQLRGENKWHRGYRLELPHREGIHAYTHVQPVKANGWVTRNPVPFAEPAIPDSFPAFPLRGSSLTTLCATLTVALHGKPVLSKLIEALKGLRVRRELTRLLDQCGRS